MRAQFFAAQCRVIGKGEYYPIADRLGTEDLQQLQPLGLARIHGSLTICGTSSLEPPAAELPAGRIGTAPDRIRVTDALLYEKVDKQPDRYQPLL